MPVGGYDFKCHIEQRLSVSNSKVLEIIISTSWKKHHIVNY